MKKHLIHTMTLAAAMLMMPQVQAEEVNTNDPTAAAISASFGWEFYNWHDDEISPGVTRPQGNDNTFNKDL